MPTEEFTIIYVKFPRALARRLDRRVEQERKERAADIDAKAITRSSIVRSLVRRWLEASSDAED